MYLCCIVKCYYTLRPLTPLYYTAGQVGWGEGKSALVSIHCTQTRIRCNVVYFDKYTFTFQTCKEGRGWCMAARFDFYKRITSGSTLCNQPLSSQVHLTITLRQTQQTSNFYKYINTYSDRISIFSRIPYPVPRSTTQNVFFYFIYTQESTTG